MTKSNQRIFAQAAVPSGRCQRFVRSVRARFQRLWARVRALEATVDPLVDHVAHLEEMLHRGDRRSRYRRRGRRAA